MIWIMFIVAMVCGISGSVLLKLSHGFSVLHYSAMAAVSYITSVVLFAQVLKTLPLGVSYAIWSGVGIVATVMLDQVLFRDSKTIWQYIFVAVILIGCIGLGLVTKVKS
jgi:multidrug transporter EmrE-like cation transporter